VCDGDLRCRTSAARRERRHEKACRRLQNSSE
jgi:hypothetical protein